ncbi:MAG: CBS domain-containing protein [Chloroflexota bacterium]|nr:CBS domain-containing protein [Chloroflexota bacterium]
MQARDIMTPNVITVSPTDTVQRLAQVLTEAGISGAPVVDDSGEIVGIVSEADVISKRGSRVEEVMHRSVVTVPEDTLVGEVCSTMTRNNINRVPVLSGDRLVGIVTRADIVRAIALGDLQREDTGQTAPVESRQLIS